MINTYNAARKVPFIVVSVMRNTPKKFLVVASSASEAIEMVNESYTGEQIVSLQQLEVDTILMNSDDVMDSATEAGPKLIHTRGN